MPKPQRDPHAPKRAQSSYLLYQNAHREQFKAENPDMKFGELSKHTASKYAALTPGEKDVWLQKAAADKARFDHELKNYHPPAGYNEKGDAIPNHPRHATPTTPTRGRKPGKRKAPIPRDPNAPKRNASAFLLYQNCYREKFRELNPGITFGQLSKYSSYMYKCLPVEEKQRWEAYAAQDKARFEAEMAAYHPPYGYDKTGAMVEELRVKTYSRRGVKDPSHPKRARGSFVYFSTEMRPKITKEYPGIKFVDMGVVLGERWRALSMAEKAKYEDMAQKDKNRFNNEMDVYAAKTNIPPQEDVKPSAVEQALAQSVAAEQQIQYAADQVYDHATAAAAHQAYFNDPNAATAFQVDPNQTTTETANNDPYSEYAQYYAEPASPTQYHYA